MFEEVMIQKGWIYRERGEFDTGPRLSLAPPLRLVVSAKLHTRSNGGVSILGVFFLFLCFFSLLAFWLLGFSASCWFMRLLLAFWLWLFHISFIPSSCSAGGVLAFAASRIISITSFHHGRVEKPLDRAPGSAKIQRFFLNILTCSLPVAKSTVEDEATQHVEGKAVARCIETAERTCSSPRHDRTTLFWLPST